MDFERNVTDTVKNKGHHAFNFHHTLAILILIRLWCSTAVFNVVMENDDTE